MEHLTPQQVATRLQVAQESAQPAPLLLDVREQWEFDTARIAGAALVPMSQLTGRIDEIADLQESGGVIRPLICVCHHGARSMQVAAYLEQRGFEQVANMTGGIHAWSQQVDPSVPTY